MPPPTTSETMNNNSNNNPQQQRQAQFQRQEQPPPQQQQQQSQPAAPASGPQGMQQQTGTAQQQQQQQYSIPGILSYLQYEWQRFELERQQWTVERAELQARISLLQGERKGQENLKNDLVRRIKMLEFCVRQERAKFHKLKFGVDLPVAGNQPEDENLNENLVNESDPLSNNNIGESDVSGLNWKQGRQLLRQYLQEIGYTDTIIDVRSNRVRSLLGLNNSLSSTIDDQTHLSADAQLASKGTVNQIKSGTGTQVRRVNQANAGLVSDTEASVLATFEFLNDQRDGAGGRGEDDEDDVDDEDEMGEDLDGSRPSFPMDVETEEVLAEFDFLNTHQQSPGNQKDVNWRNRIPDIGELATLTMNNESEMNGSSAQNNSLQNSLNADFRKTWNPKYTLKSHFDCIRALSFHASEPLLVTGSEDETLKLWNLNKTQQQTGKAGKQQPAPASGTTFDLEPVYTFRGHTSRVLSVCIKDNSIFSGAQNGQLFSWKIPENTSTIDPYDTYDPCLSHGAFQGHSDAVWSLTQLDSLSGAPLICSASADSTIRIWDVTSRECIRTIVCEPPRLHATSVACVSSGQSFSSQRASSGPLVVVSFTDGSIALFEVDSNSNQPISVFENEGSCRVNSVVVHPTLPVVVSAHEDRQIKFWDLDTGKCLHAMVAHLDEVTSLACDPNGIYLLSGSHDCSVRLWNFDSRTCVQEITSHRKKFDEAIFDVAFHPTKAFFASAGADGLAKVFV